MSSARSKPSIVAVLVLAVFGTLFPLTTNGRVGAPTALGAKAGCRCSETTATGTCCCLFEGRCGAGESPPEGPSLVSGCCSGGEHAPIAASSAARVLLVPGAAVRVFLPRVRTWSPGDALRPDDAGRETPAPVPRVADVTRAA